MRAYTDIRHHAARFAKLPKELEASFTRHRGKKPPVAGDVYVELIVRTAEGYAVSPRTNTRFIPAERWATPAKVLGSISHWRLAPELEQPHAERLAEAVEALARRAEVTTAPD